MDMKIWYPLKFTLNSLKSKVLLASIILATIEIAFILATSSDPLLIGVGLIFPIIGFFIVEIIDYVRFRHSLLDVISMDREINQINSSPLKENIKTYIDESRKNLAQFATDLKDGTVILNTEQIGNFINIIFQTKNRYEAIDISLPSEYMKNNPDYLTVNDDSFDDSKDHGYRVILQEQSDIEKDSRTQGFSRFWEWHNNNDVKLLHLSPVRANIIIKENGIDPIDCGWGIGLWNGEFAMMFSKLEEEICGEIIPKTKIIIVDNKKTKLKQLQKICKEIRNESQVMRRAGTPRIMKNQLLDVWSDYVLPEKRWDAIKPFMYQFLGKFREQQKTIIDVAAGIGIEYYYMQSDGFSIQANEVQEEFVEYGVQYGQNRDYKIKYSPTSYGWSELVERGLANMYGGAFAIGNSIRMLGNKEGQLEAVGQFHSILQRGGTLIIDEGNHERFLLHADSINRLGIEKDNTELFLKMHEITHGIPNPLYHGSNVIPIPYSLDLKNNIISFCYYYKRPRIQSLNDVEISENKIQDWVYYHYEKMEDILDKSGFTNIKKYADYDLNREMKLYEETDDASILVYVAEKA